MHLMISQVPCLEFVTSNVNHQHFKNVNADDIEQLTEHILTCSNLV